MAIFNSYVSLPEGNIYAVRYISPEHISPLGNRAALVTAPRCAKDASCSYCLLKCGDLDGGPGSMLPSSDPTPIGFFQFFPVNNTSFLSEAIALMTIQWLDSSRKMQTSSLPTSTASRFPMWIKNDEP